MVVYRVEFLNLDGTLAGRAFVRFDGDEHACSRLSRFRRTHGVRLFRGDRQVGGFSPPAPQHDAEPEGRGEAPLAPEPAGGFDPLR